MSNKQDRQGARTPADLERKYNFEKNFAEIMGVALDAQKSVKESQKKIDAELSLKLGKDDNDQIVSMLNASANTISLKSNRLEIESDNFTLSSAGLLTAKNVEIEGNISATSGQIGSCKIEGGTLYIANANCDNICAENVDISGKITSSEGYLGKIKITKEGLECGSTFLTSGGIRTNDSTTKRTTLIASGVITFDNNVSLYAPEDGVSEGFLGVKVGSDWVTLYFDKATGCVKFT